MTYFGGSLIVRRMRYGYHKMEFILFVNTFVLIQFLVKMNEVIRLGIRGYTDRVSARTIETKNYHFLSFAHSLVLFFNA